MKRSNHYSILFIMSSSVFKRCQHPSICIPMYSHYHYQVVIQICRLTKKKFSQLYLLLSNFKTIYLSKDSFYELIANLSKRFYQSMLHIWFQNKSLPDGKAFYLHLLLNLNFSKVLTTLFLIFLQKNSCKIRVTQICYAGTKNEFQ